MLNNWTPKLIEPVRWVIIVCIAITLANSVLYFISGPEQNDSSPAAAQASRTPVTREAVSINAILSRNLFGVAGESKVETLDQPTVETRLPLELRGVFVNELPEQSAAIVAQKGKTGELYAVGEVLPGNAELIEVHPDHIVLRRAGARETLRFPQLSSTPLLAGSNTNARPGVRAGSDRLIEEYEDDEVPQSYEPRGSSGATTPREFVDTYRQKLEDDPDGTLRELGIAPVNPDGSGGYRLGNLSKSPYLSQTGLQPGDIVLSVNGQSVGNIQRDRQQINSILGQGSARLEVQRGTRRFFVTASLK